MAFDVEVDAVQPGEANSAGDRGMHTAWGVSFAAWIVATTATLGSLFFSEIMGHPPCALCWYQRIAMYPLVLIFAAGMFPYDRNIFRYTFPLVLIGWSIAVYHNLLYFGVLPDTAAPCVQGVPCTAVQIEWFGFITIPVLSLTAFSLLLVLLTVLKKIGRNS